MQICIDATALLLRSAGIKSYTYHWMHALRAAGRAHRITGFPLLGGLGELDHEASVLTRAQTIPRIALLHLLNYGLLPGMDLVIGKADVFHASNQVRRLPRRPRITATVHDMTVFLMPEHHTPGNIRAEQRFADSVLRRASGLIAVSENTRNDAVRVLGIDPARIHVIYSGVSDAYFSAAPDAAVTSRYNLAKPYILYVGTIEPRKNVDLLIQAYLGLAADIREAFDLVLIGPAGWSSAQTLQQLDSPPPGVRYLGYVPETDLPALTAGASVFAYVSLYEGFGFPVAQAMAAGVPVVTSSTSCLPEIAGPGALLAEPRSLAEIRAALHKVLTSPTLRQELATAGRRYAQRYTWANCAVQSLNFFEAMT